MSKHTLFIILFLFETLMLNAQKLTVESLRKSPAGNSAHTEMRTDLNGKACALLRVSVSDDIVSCSNGNIGGVVVEGQTKLLYITSVTPFIELSFKNHFHCQSTSLITDSSILKVVPPLIWCLLSQNWLPV